MIILYIQVAMGQATELGSCEQVPLIMGTKHLEKFIPEAMPIKHSHKIMPFGAVACMQSSSTTVVGENCSVVFKLLY